MTSYCSAHFLAAGLRMRFFCSLLVFFLNKTYGNVNKFTNIRNFALLAFSFSTPLLGWFKKPNPFPQITNHQLHLLLVELIASIKLFIVFVAFFEITTSIYIVVLYYLYERYSKVRSMV